MPFEDLQGMKIAILGDSFSSDEGSSSWINLLSQEHELTNFSQRGICQFKLYEIILKNLTFLQSVDRVIIWYTNPDRIYINKGVDYPTRYESTHVFSDMVANDVLSKNNHWSDIASTYYRYFYNQDLQDFISNSIIQKTRIFFKKKNY